MNLKFLQRRIEENPERQDHRLRGIDALRGAAALGVVLYHTVGPKGANEPSIISWIATPFLPMVRLGYVGVFLFFVISGFCIHLTRARAHRDGHAPPGFTKFWKRRFRRLYPPYLVALLLFLLIAGFTTKFEATFSYIWDVLLHLLMLHNFDTRTVYSINGVFWTLAIEEQLYLAYFLLLFLRKRLGWGRTLLICLGTRLVWFVGLNAARAVFKIDIPISEAAASHWFTWALGAMSVEAMLGIIKLPRWTYKMKVAVMGICGCAALSYVLPLLVVNGMFYSLLWLVIHPLWGLSFFVLLNWFVAAEKRWRQANGIPAAVRLVASIGVFSYSLYLTHELVALEEYRFAALRLTPLLTALLVTTPISIAFAWVFFRVAEKPYLNSQSAKSTYAPAVSEAAATADA